MTLTVNVDPSTAMMTIVDTTGKVYFYGNERGFDSSAQGLANFLTNLGNTVTVVSTAAIARNQDDPVPNVAGGNGPVLAQNV